MMIEIAIGDAYGAPFEFKKNKFIKNNNNLEYISCPAKYTDDTQMSIAIVEHILDGSAINQNTIAKYFVEVYKRDRRQSSYASNFGKLLNSVRSGKALLDRLQPYSERNGCVMRSVPIGILSTVSEVMHYSIVQSSITHANFKSIRASLIVALSSHYFYYRIGSKDKLNNWLIKIDPSFSLGEFKPRRVKCDAVDTALAVMYLLMTYDSASKILYGAIDMGGDTDSVAAVAVGLCSICDEINMDLPQCLYDNLESEVYGIDYLMRKDSFIKDFYRRP